jgi:hypothetical protein
MQGEPILIPVNLLIVSIAWKKFSRPQGAGRDCGCCREDFGKLQGGAAWNCEWRQGLAQDSTSHSPASQWHRFASGRGRSQTGEARAGGLLDYTDNRGRRQRKHFQTKRMPTLSASRPKRHLPGAGLSCKPCGAQPLTGRAAIACVNAGRISRTRRIRVRYGGTPPEHILAADCRDDLASAASPPACPFLWVADDVVFATHD